MVEKPHSVSSMTNTHFVMLPLFVLLWETIFTSCAVNVNCHCSRDTFVLWDPPALCLLSVYMSAFPRFIIKLRSPVMCSTRAIYNIHAVS